MQFVHRSSSTAVNRDGLHLHSRKEGASSQTGTTFPFQVPQCQVQIQKMPGMRYRLGFGQFYKVWGIWVKQALQYKMVPTISSFQLCSHCTLPADTSTARQGSTDWQGAFSTSTTCALPMSFSHKWRVHFDKEWCQRYNVCIYWYNLSHCTGIHILN